MVWEPRNTPHLETRATQAGVADVEGIARSDSCHLHAGEIRIYRTEQEISLYKSSW